MIIWLNNCRQLLKDCLRAIPVSITMFVKNLEKKREGSSSSVCNEYGYAIFPFPKEERGLKGEKKLKTYEYFLVK